MSSERSRNSFSEVQAYAFVEEVTSGVVDTQLKQQLSRFGRYLAREKWPLPSAGFSKRMLGDESLGRLSGFRNPADTQQYFKALLKADVLTPDTFHYQKRDYVIDEETFLVFGAVALARERVEWEEGEAPPLDRTVRATLAWLGSDNPLAARIHMPSEGNTRVADPHLREFLEGAVEPFIESKFFPLTITSLYHPAFVSSLLTALEISTEELKAIVNGIYTGSDILHVIRPVIHGRRTDAPYVGKNEMRAFAAFIWTAKKQLGHIPSLSGKEDMAIWYGVARDTKQALGDSVIAQSLDERPYPQRERDRFTELYFR